MKIAVVGAGAVGLYYGALLAAAGEEVHFLMRSDYEAARESGVTVQRPGGDLVVRPALVHRSPEAIGRCDLVLIALKATANEALSALVSPLLGDETLVLTLQNGLGNEEALAAFCLPERLLGGLCFICLNRIAPGVVENFYPGYIEMGEWAGPPTVRSRELARMWDRVGVKCLVAESLPEARWRKLCWNIPFNGLAVAAGGIDTREILSQPALVDQIWHLMREVQAAARQLGYKIDDAFLQRQIDVTMPMGPYKPSTLIDYELGRPIEVEAIWGEALRRARTAGVETPRLETLYALLRSIARNQAV